MSNILDETNGALSEIRITSMELSELAGAFNKTGNIPLAEKLWDIVATLDTAEQEIQDAIGAEISDRLKSSQQATANMIGAVLAVGKMKQN